MEEQMMDDGAQEMTASETSENNVVSSAEDAAQNMAEPLLGGDADKAHPLPQSENAGDWTLEAGKSGLDVDDLKRLESWAKDMGLSREQAERIRDRHAVEQSEREAVMRKQDIAWQRELAGDPDFGGANWDRTVSDANRALRQYDPTGEAVELLRSTGYGSHPAIVRVLARIGRDMAEDNVIRGGGKREIPLEDRLYGKN